MRHLKLSFVLAGVLAAPLAPPAAAALCMPGPQAAPGARQNVLLIIADDVGVDSVGCYGEGTDPPPTPNIDSLARQGVLFRNAWANPVCSPTRACIQTGRLGFRTGVGNVVELSGAELPSAETILPEALAAAGTGHAHALFGKWHLGTSLAGAMTPNVHGYGHFAGMLENIEDYYAYEHTVDGATSPCTTYATTQTADDALAWIGAQSGRWLAVVAFNAAHKPFHAPPDHLHSQRLPDYPGAEQIEPFLFYRAMVEAMDSEIGRLLAGVDLATTTVLFIGDNGTPSQASRPPFPMTHAKGTPFEGGINVPLVAAGPLVRRPGRQVRELVHASDLFVTALDLCGARLDDALPQGTTLDGVSLVPYLVEARAQPQRVQIYSELFGGGDVEWVEMRDARYKLVRTTAPFPHELLFDLKKDPFESEDLLAPGGIPENPRAAAAYRALSRGLDRLLLTAPE